MKIDVSQYSHIPIREKLNLNVTTFSCISQHSFLIRITVRSRFLRKKLPVLLYEISVLFNEKRNVYLNVPRIYNRTIQVRFPRLLTLIAARYSNGDVLSASPGHYSVGFDSNYARRIGFALVPLLSKLVDLVIKKLRSISDVRAALTAVYIRLLHRARRRLQKGVEDGVGARMEYAEDHYVQVESAMLRSLCYTPARYNFRVSQWLGCERKVKTTTDDNGDRPPEGIGGGRRAVETVLCNNNWMAAVSFHLGMTPFASRDRRRTKKRKKDRASPVQGSDGEGRTISAQL